MSASGLGRGSSQSPPSVAEEAVPWEGLGRPRVPVAEPVQRCLGRPGFACTEPVMALTGRGRGWDKWSDLDGGFSMRFWDACDLLAETGVRLAGGVLGLVLSVLGNAVAPRVVDRRVTVIVNVVESPGASFVVHDVLYTGDHGDIHADHVPLKPGPTTLTGAADTPEVPTARADTPSELHA